MDINFDDSSVRQGLYPFTSTRNAADIRVGILTIREKWSLLVEKNIVRIPEDTVLPGNIIPTIHTAAAIVQGSKEQTANVEEIKLIERPWQIFQLNDWALRRDFELVTAGRRSQQIPASNKVSSPENIFIEDGAVVEHCVLNASTGPIYIGNNAGLMEGCLVRGPFALCEGSILKMGTKVYGATTLGPYCVGGGEIKNVVMFGYSNKAHNGYLGDSVVGAWCNLGAGTSNSNVLNTAGMVKVWDNLQQSFKPVGLKCGLLMGDYSRAAINTSFNTGTTIGVCCNIFSIGFPPKLVSDFSWGQETYNFDKAMVDISNWKKLKGHQLLQDEKEHLKQLYTNQSSKQIST